MKYNIIGQIIRTAYLIVLGSALTAGASKGTNSVGIRVNISVNKIFEYMAQSRPVLPKRFSTATQFLKQSIATKINLLDKRKSSYKRKNICLFINEYN
jgi:hypothetical protein